MAGYRQHIGVSGLLGVVYGAAATFVFGFTPVQGTLAFMFTWFAGMLPDIDSQTGRPVQEIFGAISLLAPLLLMQHLAAWGGDHERVLLLTVLFYLAIREGGPFLLGKLSVHRGMFHSIPVLLIFSLATFLAYKHDDKYVRMLMGLGVALGFLSHLVLDEIYSVQWTGTKIKLAKSAGSALKWFSSSVAAGAFCWGSVMFLSYLTLSDLGLLDNRQTTLDVEEPAADSSPAAELGSPDVPPPVDLGSSEEFPVFQ
jgi:membrane-bound metal-dependent hydrolase YbcI (DUF457 family)